MVGGIWCFSANQGVYVKPVNGNEGYVLLTYVQRARKVVVSKDVLLAMVKVLCPDNPGRFWKRLRTTGLTNGARIRGIITVIRYEFKNHDAGNNRYNPKIKR